MLKVMGLVTLSASHTWSHHLLHWRREKIFPVTASGRSWARCQFMFDYGVQAASR